MRHFAVVHSARERFLLLWTGLLRAEAGAGGEGGGGGGGGGDDKGKGKGKSAGTSDAHPGDRLVVLALADLAVFAEAAHGKQPHLSDADRRTIAASFASGDITVARTQDAATAAFDAAALAPVRVALRRLAQHSDDTRSATRAVVEHLADSQVELARSLLDAERRLAERGSLELTGAQTPHAQRKYSPHSHSQNGYTRSPYAPPSSAEVNGAAPAQKKRKAGQGRSLINPGQRRVKPEETRFASDSD